MAVNLADGTLFAGMYLIPIVAGVGAIAAGAPWFTIPFAAAGFLFGLEVANVGRMVTYSSVGFGLRIAVRMNFLAGQVFFLPFFGLYIVLPYAFFGAGVAGAFFGAAWSARYVTSYLSGWAEIAVGIFSSVASVAAMVVLYKTTNGLASLIWDVNLPIPELDDEQETVP